MPPPAARGVAVSPRGLVEDFDLHRAAPKPGSEPLSPFQLMKKIERTFEGYVRPMLQKDGGDIELIDIKDRTDSGLWIGAVLIAAYLPTVVVGLLLGPLLDRLPRRNLMIAADVVRAAVFCALPFAGSAGAIVALASVAGLANGFFRPAAKKHRQPNFPTFELAFVKEPCSWEGGRHYGGCPLLCRRKCRSGSRLIVVLEEAQQLVLICCVGTQVQTDAFGVLML